MLFRSTIVQPTVDRSVPGQDVYATLRTQTTWGINSGKFSINTGIYFSLGAGNTFPEYFSGDPDHPDYAVTHAYNCGNHADSYGWGTYYFDDATVHQYSGGVGKGFSQNELDVKALNCTPNALFAAFCAWDGGQLVTAEALDYIGTSNFPEGENRINPGATVDCDGLNIAGDASSHCDAVFNHPMPVSTVTGASRIASPGYVAADAVRINDADEPWRDLKGNLMDLVVLPGDSFGYRGKGLGYSSIKHHLTQVLTPRMKTGSLGARCMRFK